MDLMSPGHFQYGEAAPTYENPYAGGHRGPVQKQQDYGDFSYRTPPPIRTATTRPSRSSSPGFWSGRTSPMTRPQTPYTRTTGREYTREGQRATEDALGAAAAASGGIPSSYASTVAGQAGNYYAAQLTDKIPELYELAYNQYLNDYNMQLSDLGVVQGAEQSDYDKFLNSLNQYNTDREFAYNNWLNGYNQLNNDLNTALGSRTQGSTSILPPWTSTIPTGISPMDSSPTS